MDMILCETQHDLPDESHFAKGELKNILAYSPGPLSGFRWVIVSLEHFLDFQQCYTHWAYLPFDS